MNSSVNSSPNTPPPSRRQFLAAIALLGAAAITTGCQTQQEFLPGPVYPDIDPEASESPVTQKFVEPTSAPLQKGTWTPPKVNPLPSGVISRATWAKAPPMPSLADPMNGVSRITIHHDAIAATKLVTQGDAMRRLEQLRQGHRRNNWADIGYHYIIDPQGRIWEGRPLWLQGAHVRDTNEHNIGVMAMGNFELHAPTGEQLQSLDNFVASLCQTHRIPIGRVKTHRELKPTLCPGKNLQKYMAQTRASGGRLARMT